MVWCQLDERKVKTGSLPQPINISAELGDFDSGLHTAAFVSEFRFVPVQTEEMEEEILSVYSQLTGRSPAEAESEYLRVARQPSNILHL